MTGFQDSRCEPFAQCQTILDFTAADGGASDENHNFNMSKVLIKSPPVYQDTQSFYRIDALPATQWSVSKQ